MQTCYHKCAEFKDPQVEKGDLSSEESQRVKNCCEKYFALYEKMGKFMKEQ